MLFLNVLSKSRVEILYIFSFSAIPFLAAWKARDLS